MSSKHNETRRDKDFKKLKWQLTALSGALTTSLIVVLES